MSYRDAVLSTNPVGYWRLGEPSGTVAVDVMGLNNGTYVNAPTLGVAGLLTGDPDTAMTGTGSSYMQFSCGALSAYSITFWAKCGAGSGSPHYLFGNASDAPDISNNYTTGKVQAYISGWRDMAPFAVGEKAMFCLTFDGTTTTFYKNGASTYSAVIGGTLPAVANAFGGYPVAGVGVVDTIDEPAIWNRALTAAEVAMLYAEGLADPSYHLAPLWFGDGTQEPWQGTSDKRYDNLPPTPDRG